MRKFPLFNLLLLFTTIAIVPASCQSNKTDNAKGIPVDIVFEKWHIQYGQLKSMDITLKAKSKSGDPITLSSKLAVNQYDEFLLPTLVTLEEKDEFKDGNTGSGIVIINEEFGNGTLHIKKVGKVATKDMEFRLTKEEISTLIQ